MDQSDCWIIRAAKFKLQKMIIKTKEVSRSEKSSEKDLN